MLEEEDAITNVMSKIKTEIKRISGFSGYKSPDNFTPNDIILAGDFLYHDRLSKEHYPENLENSSNVYLQGMLCTKLYDYNQKEYFEIRKKNIDTIDEIIKEITWGNANDSAIENKYYIEKFPEIAISALEMEKAFIGSVPAYVRLKADEKNLSVYDVVRTEECRNEIYKRIFPIKNEFKGYHGVLNQINGKFSVIHDIIKNPTKNNKTLNTYLKEFMSFIEEDNDYNEKRAEEIYS